MHGKATSGWYFWRGRCFYGYLQEVITNVFQPYTLNSSAIIIGGHILKVSIKEALIWY
jgi:hypothetical protein